MEDHYCVARLRCHFFKSPPVNAVIPQVVVRSGVLLLPLDGCSSSRACALTAHGRLVRPCVSRPR
jgi:hypothetical protein